VQPQARVQAWVQGLAQALRRLVLEQERTGSGGQGQRGAPPRASEAQQSEKEKEAIEEAMMCSISTNER
jgi:hypothetical protein